MSRRVVPAGGQSPVPCRSHPSLHVPIVPQTRVYWGTGLGIRAALGTAPGTTCRSAASPSAPLFLFYPEMEHPQRLGCSPPACFMKVPDGCV